MRLVAFLAIFILHTIHAAEPAQKVELFIGQKWESAKVAIAKARLPEAGPRQEFRLDDNECHNYQVDEELIVTIEVSPSSKLIVSMFAYFEPANRTSRADFVGKAVNRISIESQEFYSIQFKRDLRTPEEKKTSDLEFQRIFRERVEKASKEKAAPVK